MTVSRCRFNIRKGKDMVQLKNLTKKLILIIVTISLVLTFVITPSAQAKLTLEEGEFYYSGTTKGTYKAATNIFAWLLDNIGDIADWLLGIMTMGFRMVFVGWTALIEKILTWTLEGTTGVNVEGEEVSSTDLTSLTDSSNNVTVQAIVYNQVPALSIDFFDLEYDKTYSGTGKKLRCDKCGEDVENCCTETGCKSSCTCKGNCDGCQRYIAALNITGEPVIVQIKNVVATWYYVMLFLSAAAMLVVFLGVGIKMALSTIASEKAVYKRMLVDWVVGMIIVFAIHYAMILIVHINNSLVQVIKESANSINEVSMMQLAEKSEDVIEYTDEELEIDIYEAVRTRAYDAKLINGMTGMVMYMTLVYFAIRYTIVYLKRLLTLIVLTLMGPAVGVSYALQKVFSGKGSSLTTWTTEYIMNVMIQSVHAIIYSVFISAALIMSLQSVAGMILALILMNYALKAEKSFRTIFKMGSNGSLLDSTAGAGDAEKLKENFDGIKGVVIGAKPLGKALMNSPYAKALKGAGKVGVAAGLGLARAGKAGVENYKSKAGERYEKAVDKQMTKMYGSPEAYRNSRGEFTETDAEYEARRGAARDVVDSKRNKKVKPNVPQGTPVTSNDSTTDFKTLLAKGEKGIKQDILDAQREVSLKVPGAEDKLRSKMGDLIKYNELNGNLSQKDIASAHLNKLVSIENHFSYDRKENGKVGVWNALKGTGKGIFGTSHYDQLSGKKVSDKNGLYHELSAENLLGFTAADKKVFKEQVLNPIRNGFGGIATMFIGMGTMVAHPKIGIAMALAGGSLANGAIKAKIDPTKYNGTYSFVRFGTPTMRKMQREALKRSKKEWNKAVKDNVMQNHPELYKNIKHDLGIQGKLSAQVQDIATGGKMAVSVATVGLVGGVLPQAVPLAAVAGTGFMATKLMGRTGFGGNLSAVDLHSAKQLREQQIKFVEDGFKVQSVVQSAVLEHNYKLVEKQMLDQEIARQGLAIDSKTGEIVAKNSQEVQEAEKAAKQALDNYNAVIAEIYASQGMKYDPTTGLATADESKNDKAVKSKTTIEQSEFVDKVDGKTISDAEYKQVEKEIDIVVDQFVKSTENLDMNTEQAQSEAMKRVTDRLVKAGILKDNQKVSQVFKRGEAAVIESLKKKTEVAKEKAKAADKLLDGLDQGVKSQVETAVREISATKTGDQRVTVQEVLSRVTPTDTSSRVQVSDTSSTVRTGDGTVKANSSRDGSISLSTKDASIIEQYVNIIQARPGEAITTDPKKTVKKAIEHKADRAKANTEIRKRKLDQIMSMTFDDATLDDIASDVGNNKGINVNGVQQVAKEDSQDVLELLFMRKELEKVNEFAVKELKTKKGTKGYDKVDKDEKAKKVAYYEASLAHKKSEAELSSDKVQRFQAAIDSKTQLSEDGFKDYLESHKKVTESKAQWDEAKIRKNTEGPIVNVTSVVNNIIGDIDAKEARHTTGIVMKASEVKKDTSSQDVIKNMRAGTKK